MYKNKKFLVLAGLVTAIIAVFAASVEMGSRDSFGTERHTKYTLYIGLNDGDTGIQKHTTAQARDMLNDIAVKYIDGYTVYEADGYWKEDGSTFNEHTLVCVMIDVPEQSVKSIMNETLKALNQHSILLEISEIKNTFYSGE